MTEASIQSSIQVVYTDHGGEGYHCVLHMARLASKLLDGELITIPAVAATNASKLAAIFLPQKKLRSTCLLICPSPVDLGGILLIPNWRQKFSRIVAWVFDSFWTNYIPPWVRASRIFDHVFVTERDDLPTWRRKIHAPVDWLPWGSDVLNLGSPNGLRPIDLLRFGRQPMDWDDDLRNAQACQASGIAFHGRPRSLSDATDNQRGLMETLSKTKFALAFSNRVSPGKQTHPTREYITGRWTDALASGATVAGVPPRSESVDELLWPEAMLDLGTVDQAQGLKLIGSMARSWTADRAQLNYMRALERLDWRLRLQTVAGALDAQPLPLQAELARLSQAIRSTQPAERIIK